MDLIRYERMELTNEPVVIMRIVGDSVNQVHSIFRKVQERNPPFLIRVINTVCENGRYYVSLFSLSDWIGYHGVLFLLLSCFIHSEWLQVERGGVEGGRILHSAWTEVAS